MNGTEMRDIYSSFNKISEYCHQTAPNVTLTGVNKFMINVLHSSAVRYHSDSIPWIVFTIAERR